MAAGEMFALLALSWPAIAISLIEMAARRTAARRSAKAKSNASGSGSSACR
jgi:hypothetical protein